MPTKIDLTVLCAMLLATTACSGSSSSSSSSSSGSSSSSSSSSSGSSHHSILDLDDRCPWLPTDCPQHFSDDDGCPDTIINFPPQSASIQRDALPILHGIAEELVAAPCVELVEVMGYDSSHDPSSALAMARAHAIIAILIEAGVDSRRMKAIAGRTVGDDPAYGAFFVMECAASCIPTKSHEP